MRIHYQLLCTYTQKNAKDTSSRWRRNVSDGNSNVQDVTGNEKYVINI